MSRPLDPTTAEVDAVAAVVLDCPAVAALHPGDLAHRTVTYLPGRRLEGVRIDDQRIAVSIVGVQGIPVALLVEQVRSAVGPLAAGRPVDVHVADLQLLTEQPPALPASSSV